MIEKVVGFIGAGNMGGAIMRGLISKGFKGPIIVADPQKELREALARESSHIKATANNMEAAKSDLLVLAVKPQIYPLVIEEIRDAIRADTVIVTIAAGLRINTVAEWFGGAKKIIRTMPNTPALVGEGMTALCPGPGVEEADINAVWELFESVGKVVDMPESLMDAYSALAGSSPAWVYLFLEALADGAVREGMPRLQAYQIAGQAILGSAKMALEAEEHPGVLKDQVCSPGGTTIESVASLEKAGFRSAIIDAVSVCTTKARRLGCQ